MNSPSIFVDSGFIAKDDKEGRLLLRSKIESYEASLKEELGSDRGEMDEINRNGLVEYFVDGAYVRSLFIPKGITIVSELWKKERLWIIASGKVSITTEEGNYTVEGPYTALAPFGSKVALYALEDTLWFAVTGSQATNSKDVEKEIVAKSYSELTYPWDMLESGEKSE